MNVDNLIKYLNINEHEARKLIKRSVEIAKIAKKEAQCEDRLIAGSIGPYGANLHDGSEYSGQYANNMSLEELKEWHRPRIESLIEAGVDLLAFETIPSIKEGMALCSLLSEYPNQKAWLSFSCKNNQQLCIGDFFSDAYEIFREYDQLIAVGINCTDPSYIENLLKSVKIYSKPFIVYSNDGTVWDAVNRTYIIDEKHKQVDMLLKLLPEWIKLGTKFIGGCCGLGSKDIGVINEFLKSNFIGKQT